MTSLLANYLNILFKPQFRRFRYCHTLRGLLHPSRLLQLKDFVEATTEAFGCLFISKFLKIYYFKILLLFMMLCQRPLFLAVTTFQLKLINFLFCLIINIARVSFKLCSPITTATQYLSSTMLCLRIVDCKISRNFDQWCCSS